jgi:hypothetical protein
MTTYAADQPLRPCLWLPDESPSRGLHLMPQRMHSTPQSWGAGDDAGVRRWRVVSFARNLTRVIYDPGNIFI